MVLIGLYCYDRSMSVSVWSVLLRTHELSEHCENSAGRCLCHGFVWWGISQERIEEIGALIDKRPEVSRKNSFPQMMHGTALRKSIFRVMRMDLPRTRLQILPAMKFIWTIFPCSRHWFPIWKDWRVREVNRSEVTASALTGVNALIAYVSIGIIAILLAVSVFLISNTVTIGISVRKEEITIMKYIGATDYFVRAPFVIEGMLIGAIEHCFR